MGRTTLPSWPSSLPRSQWPYGPALVHMRSWSLWEDSYMAGRHIGIFSRGWEKAAVLEVLKRLGHVWTSNMA
jgi:hypothetical protein